MSRVRGARAFLDRIRPAIEGAQGTIAAERIATLTPAGGPPAEAPPEVPAPPGYLPEVLFGLFLVNAACVLMASRFPQTQFGNVLLTTFFAEFVILVVALVRRPGTRSAQIHLRVDGGGDVMYGLGRDRAGAQLRLVYG